MSEMKAKVRAAADVGGTFIDFVAVDTVTGDVNFDKQPASSDRLVEEFLEGLSRLGLTGADIDQLFHGTTVAINAVVQERGAKVGLVTTRGFRDVLEIGRGGRPEVYNFQYTPARPLVPRDLRFEVTERMSNTGDVLTPLASDEIEIIAKAMAEAGVEAVAVSLLHSYANPAHEQEIARLLRDALPLVPITVSHQVAREWQEYERTSSAVINAYVQPVFGRYLEELTSQLAENGYMSPLGIMQSNGGVLSADRAAVVPVRTLMSGPAGGVVACRELARSAGVQHAICADVGGTTFDVALISDGDLVESTQTKLNGRPLLGTMVDITSVGAGGGSIAWIDDLGALRVGPVSAGAVPGPVCFGKGGTEPTVTDAQLVLGRLDAKTFLGGRMQLDAGGAEAAIRDRVAEPLDLDIVTAALGILRIAETNMMNATRAITVGRGLDPRDFALISYGGGGGLFAALLAAEIGVTYVIAPVAAANFSAWGILSSDYYEDAARTYIRGVDAETLPAVEGVLDELAQEVSSGLGKYGFADDLVEVSFSADIRFIGQHHTVTVPFVPGWREDAQQFAKSLHGEFVVRHDRMYGPRTSQNAVEVVCLRARGRVMIDKPTLPELDAAENGAAHGTRIVHFSHEPDEAQLYERSTLAPDQLVAGPAVIEEWANTTLVPPGWSARVDLAGHLHLTLSDTAANDGETR